MATVGIGLAGAGNVGGALARRLIEDREAIREKTGLDLELRRVAVRDATRDRGIPASLITTDALSCPVYMYLNRYITNLILPQASAFI